MELSKTRIDGRFNYYPLNRGHLILGHYHQGPVKLRHQWIIKSSSKSEHDKQNCHHEPTIIIIICTAAIKKDNMNNQGIIWE